MFACLAPAPPDPLLSLIEAFNADPRPDKLDLGVGVFRDAAGETPVLRAVKAAEAIILETQTTKTYVGAAGDTGFVESLAQLVFGDAARPLWGMQAPGGTAALRLVADLLARAGVRAVHLAAPAWPNHEPVFTAARLQSLKVQTFDTAAQRLDYQAFRDALAGSAPGEAVLLQASCHNPTGADFSFDEWRDLAELIDERGLVPLIDAAYLGLGAGIDADAAGLRLVAAAAPVCLVAVSCSKMFGIYRERTAALFLGPRAKASRGAIASNLLAIARANYSMPPDHGAAVVRTILEAPGLRADWLGELAGMRRRIGALRGELAAQGMAGAIDLAPLGRQRGMFSLLGLSPGQMEALRGRHGVHLAPGGRINVAGLTEAQVPRFARVLAQVAAA